MKTLTLIGAACMLLMTTAQAQTDWRVGGNNLSANGRLGSLNNWDVLFITNNAERGRLTRAGLWGFGSNAPNAKVHINSTASQTPLRVDVANATKLLVNNNGGVSIGANAVTPANGLFVQGGVGIGTNNLGNYKAKIFHGAFGFDLQSSATFDDWEFFVDGIGLHLYATGEFVGSFNQSDGVYTPISDERLKTDIKAMPSVLEKVNQLKPSTYRFKKAINTTGSGAPESYGFLAQDVMKIFPGLVKHNVNKERILDVYTLNYNGISAIAIKAIQELQQTINAVIQTNNALTAENEELKSRLSAIEQALNISNKQTITPALTGAYLGTAIPNPANRQTVISYYLPQNAGKAVINISDMSGTVVKSIPLAAQGKGQVVLNAGQFAAGTYSYALIVNGQVADAKKLVLTN